MQRRLLRPCEQRLVKWEPVSSCGMVDILTEAALAIRSPRLRLINTHDYQWTHEAGATPPRQQGASAQTELRAERKVEPAARMPEATGTFLVYTRHDNCTSTA